MTIGERIRLVRTDAGLTQQEFAQRLEIKQNTVATYESGATKPSDRIVSSICRLFGVNRAWILDGTGDMLRPVTRDEEIAYYMGRILSDEDAAFQRRIISAMSEIPPEVWPELERFVRRLVEDDSQKKDT